MLVAHSQNVIQAQCKTYENGVTVAFRRNTVCFRFFRRPARMLGSMRTVTMQDSLSF